MSRDELIKEIESLADTWADEVKSLRHNRLPGMADNLKICVDDLRAIVRRATREGGKE
jgi:cob(I)alamin adenosyltransferase